MDKLDLMAASMCFEVQFSSLLLLCEMKPVVGDIYMDNDAISE